MIAKSGVLGRVIEYSHPLKFQSKTGQLIASTYNNLLNCTKLNIYIVYFCLSRFRMWYLDRVSYRFSNWDLLESSFNKMASNQIKSNQITWSWRFERKLKESHEEHSIWDFDEAKASSVLTHCLILTVFWLLVYFS